jgi:hypothetical protein
MQLTKIPSLETAGELSNPHPVIKLVNKAYNVLNGQIPKPGNNCEYCKWKEETSKVEG